MREMALLGKKSCGCPVFARLVGPRIYGSGRIAKNLRVERVPVEQANVSVCRCES